MKRFVSIIAVVMLLFPCFAVAESPVIDIDGEWYVFRTYTENYKIAKLDEEDCFHIYIKGNDDSELYRLYSNGLFVSDDEKKYELQHVAISDEAHLYYLFQNKEFVCELMIFSEGVWKNYEGTCFKLLLYNGNMIPASGGEKGTYFLNRNSIYFINTDSYVRGDIVRYGEDIFACVTEEEPGFEGIEGISEIGYPEYFFICTDIHKQ